MPLGMEVSLGPGDFVFDGDPPPPLEKRAQPLTQFLAHVSYGQATEWIKMPLGTEVDLDPGHIVLDGVPALRESSTAAPLFSAHDYCGHGRPSLLGLLLSSCSGLLSVSLVAL